MKTLLLFLAIVTTTFAGLNDPVEFRGTVAGVVMERLEDGSVVLCATQVRSKKFDLETAFYVVVTNLPAGTKAYKEETFKCTGVLTAERKEVLKGYRPMPVFRYVGP